MRISLFECFSQLPIIEFSWRVTQVPLAQITLKPVLLPTCLAVVGAIVHGLFTLSSHRTSLRCHPPLLYVECTSYAFAHTVPLLPLMNWRKFWSNESRFRWPIVKSSFSFRRHNAQKASVHWVSLRVLLCSAVRFIRLRSRGGLVQSHGCGCWLSWGWALAQKGQWPLE